MSELVLALVNCASKKEASTIVGQVLKRRLAAAANIHAPIESTYHWQDEIQTAIEVPVLFKTTRHAFDQLAQLVEQLHSYDTPGVIAMPIEQVNGAYEDWVIKVTSVVDD